MRWPLLGALDDETAAAVLASTTAEEYERGDLVFFEGDRAEALYLIDTGHAAVRVTTLDGDTAMIRVLGPGQYFGELGIVSPAPRIATVAALDHLEVLVWRRADFEALRQRHGGVDSLLIEALAGEVRRLTMLLSEAYHLPVAARVARRLAELSVLYASEGDRGPVALPFTQEDLAQLVGTARPTANQALRALQDEGLIEITRGRITVLDGPALTSHGP